MATLKCKMCGGALNISQGETVAVCEYCGTKQTLPRLDSETKSNFYDRANHFRRNDEFDKAMAIYEQILNEDSTDAEAYWSLVLCRYGIEYVEDPATRQHVPTVNRAQFTSIFDDDNYKMALKYADGYQKEIYEREAAAINEIQKNILAISQQEEPFDVFICYKETDSSGKRTPDSVLANDLYHELTEVGFKVFFSRITLEDKLGTAYEPYIFAALNSSKVMVVLGTKPEYFNAAWVKNEWSRYLALIKGGAKKALIPAYRDMDPYDMPEEFSHLQAQDMSKLGFMPDLIRGIKKLVNAEDSPNDDAEVSETGAVVNTAPLLKRVFLFLEDSDWKSADEYCERVLDTEPENPLAYLGKLMAELRVCKKEQLKDCPTQICKKNNYLKAVRFADADLKAELTEYNQYIVDRIETERLDKIYNSTLKQMELTTTEYGFKDAAKTFQSISGYKDADALAKKCLELAESTRKDDIYNSAVRNQKENYITSLERAIELFESISDWKDSSEKISACRMRIDELKAEDERKRIEKEQMAQQKRIAAEKHAQKVKKVTVIAVLAAVFCITCFLIVTMVIVPNLKYNKAVKRLAASDYKGAYNIFETLGNYKDSAEQLKKLQSEFRVIENGYSVVFGSYEQDNNLSNGKEDIEWLILDKEDNKFLVISKYSLDYLHYNTPCLSATWESCTLRKWLNEDFYNAAFSAEEQNQILTAVLKNPGNRNISGCDDTTDRIFILNLDEADNYFSSNKSRCTTTTAYAAAQGRAARNTYGKQRWWLRSPGTMRSHAADVDQTGDINKIGNSMYYVYNGVRPAMWITIKP